MHLHTGRLAAGAELMHLHAGRRIAAHIIFGGVNYEKDDQGFFGIVTCPYGGSMRE